MTLPLIERAFELAGSGRCGSMRDIRLALKAEGYAYVNQTMQGASLRGQLKALIDAAAKAPADAP